MSISGLSDALIKVILKNNEIPEMEPDDDYIKDEVASFGIYEARKHRARGITMGGTI